MPFLLFITLSVFAISFLATPMLGDGWFWDIGNALGFAGFAGLLFQMVPAAKPQRARRHEILGYWVAGVIFAHAFWFLAGDGVVRVYLLPGAPLHMWLGLIGIAIVSILIVMARMPDRVRAHAHYRAFKSVHRLLEIVAVAAISLHIVLSGFYISAWWQVFPFIALALACCFAWQQWRALAKPSPVSGMSYAIVGVTAVAVFVLVRNIAP